MPPKEQSEVPHKIVRVTAGFSGLESSLICQRKDSCAGQNTELTDLMFLLITYKSVFNRLRVEEICNLGSGKRWISFSKILQIITRTPTIGKTQLYLPTVAPSQQSQLVFQQTQNTCSIPSMVLGTGKAKKIEKI